MGLDYIRTQTGKPWRKRWDGGLDRLKTPTLLDATMSESSRVVTATLDPRAREGRRQADRPERSRRPDRQRRAYARSGASTIPRPSWRRLSKTAAAMPKASSNASGCSAIPRRSPSNESPAAHEPSRQLRRPQRLWDDATRHAPSLGCPTCSSAIAAAASIPMPASSIAGSLHLRRQDEVRHGLPVQPECVRGAHERGQGLDFEECAADELERRAESPARRALRRSPLRPCRAPRRARGRDLALRPGQHGDRQGPCRFAGELAARFLIPEGAQIVVSGVDKDGPIERWWELKDRRSILAALKDLGITLVTAPNYSVLTDVPRTDNLHAMKRILLAWTEMSAAGLPSALHVNGRTEHDYVRWGDLIAVGRRSKISRSSSPPAAGAASASTGTSRSSARSPAASVVHWRSLFAAAGASSMSAAALRASEPDRDRGVRAHDPSAEGLSDGSRAAEVGQIRDTDRGTDRRSLRAQCEPGARRLRDAPLGDRLTIAAGPAPARSER